jgi:hypothetical protein
MGRRIQRGFQYEVQYGQIGEKVDFYLTLKNRARVNLKISVHHRVKLKVWALVLRHGHNKFS